MWQEIRTSRAHQHGAAFPRVPRRRREREALGSRDEARRARYRGDYRSRSSTRLQQSLRLYGARTALGDRLSEDVLRRSGVAEPRSLRAAG